MYQRISNEHLLRMMRHEKGQSHLVRAAQYALNLDPKRVYRHPMPQPLAELELALEHALAENKAEMGTGASASSVFDVYARFWGSLLNDLGDFAPPLYVIKCIYDEEIQEVRRLASRLQLMADHHSQNRKAKVHAAGRSGGSWKQHFGSGGGGGGGGVYASGARVDASDLAALERRVAQAKKQNQMIQTDLVRPLEEELERAEALNQHQHAQNKDIIEQINDLEEKKLKSEQNNDSMVQLVVSNKEALVNAQKELKELEEISKELQDKVHYLEDCNRLNVEHKMRAVEIRSLKEGMHKISLIHNGKKEATKRLHAEREEHRADMLMYEAELRRLDHLQLDEKSPKRSSFIVM